MSAINPVHLQGLTKSWGAQQALSSINATIREGELFGWIGPDGAGKTTLFRILTTLLVPDSGSATVLGFDTVREYRELRPRLGYMPGTFSLYQDLSVRENLEFFASVFGTTVYDGYDLIKPIFRQLEPFQNRLAGQLSGGMKQKLALSCALIHKPELLILDEPTTGVDAVSRKEFWDMLQILKEEGMTIIVSTPYMDEAVRCDRIALLHNGVLLETGTPEKLTEGFTGNLLGVVHPEKYKLIKILRSMPYVRAVYPFGERVHVTTEQSITPGTLVSDIERSGLTGCRAYQQKADIEDVFMSRMNVRQP